MYPLRRKPTKAFSKVVIVLIWMLSLAFALPVGYVHSFKYVPDNNTPEEGDEKPFCYIDLGDGDGGNGTQSAAVNAFVTYK